MRSNGCLSHCWGRGEGDLAASTPATRSYQANPSGRHHCGENFLNCLFQIQILCNDFYYFGDIYLTQNQNIVYRVTVSSWCQLLCCAMMLARTQALTDHKLQPRPLLRWEKRWSVAMCWSLTFKKGKTFFEFHSSVKVIFRLHTVLCHPSLANSKHGHWCNVVKEQ